MIDIKEKPRPSMVWCDKDQQFRALGVVLRSKCKCKECGINMETFAPLEGEKLSALRRYYRENT